MIRFRSKRFGLTPCDWRFDSICCYWRFDLDISDLAHESRSSPATAESSDMPCSYHTVFSKFTASSRASLPLLVICNGEDNLYLMQLVRQDNPAAFWASSLADGFTLSHAPSGQEISKCPSNISLCLKACYRAKLRVARYCHGMLSVRLSVCPSVCDVEVS